MKTFSTAGALLVAVLCFVAVAAADPGDQGKGANKSHHGKFTYTVVTTDNGSCGSAWANDTLVRTFVVKDNGDGTFTLTRRDRGLFSTIAGVSPGACEKTSHHGQTVRAGVTGKLVGYLRGTVTGGTFDPKATCTGPDCGFTDTFLATFFGTSAQFSCFTTSADCSFVFNYTAAKHQKLEFRHWQDKGKGAGTLLNERFVGDIADA
jgi:hypothetical protein